MPTCSEPKCVALATNGDRCVLHASGYKRNGSGAELRCANCRGLIRKDEWFQTRDAAMFHVKSCKTHPDVVSERATA